MSGTMTRVVTSGTLAEIFGRPLLQDDIFVRQLGIRRSVEAVWKGPRLDGRVRREIEAYCAGVNARLLPGKLTI